MKVSIGSLAEAHVMYLLYIPVTITRDHIVDPKLLADLFDAQVQGVSLKLFAGEVRHDHRGQAHQTGGLVLLLVSPAVALLAPFHAIGRGLCYSKRTKVRNKHL